jgi:hypothetical protein
MEFPPPVRIYLPGEDLVVTSSRFFFWQNLYDNGFIDEGFLSGVVKTVPYFA